MSINVVMTIVPGGAMCANACEAEKLERIKGHEVMVSISRPRNLQYHKKFFAMLNVSRSICDCSLNSEQFRAICITGAGWCDFVEHDGKMVAIPRSLKFASMSEDEFDNLYGDVLDWIIGNWELDRDQLEQILSFL